MGPRLLYTILLQAVFLFLLYFILFYILPLMSAGSGISIGVPHIEEQVGACIDLGKCRSPSAYRDQHRNGIFLLFFVFFRIDGRLVGQRWMRHINQDRSLFHQITFRRMGLWIFVFLFFSLRSLDFDRSIRIASIYLVHPIK